LPTSLSYGPANGSDHNTRVQLPTSAGSGEIRLGLSGDKVTLDYQGAADIALNGTRAAGREQLKLGDVISLSGSEISLRMIQVE